jgi:bifunctional DNA-binding transcriptional regulator/antitoxin component of YhaV-PrlF toxin-antitoxin module
MTTTVNVLPKGKMELPQEFRRRKRIREGTTLRVTGVADGLYVSPLREPTEKELREVIAAAGSISRSQNLQEEKRVERIISEYRTAQRRKH